MGIRIEDLPHRLQAQARRQLAGSCATPDTRPASPVRTTSKTHREPTKTEAEYARLYLADKTPLYEALTFRLANGHRYTPDWVYWYDGSLHCVEVKGSYRLGSYQRARLAFDQARIEWPLITWIWAEKRDGEWKSKSNSAGERTLPAGEKL